MSTKTHERKYPNQEKKQHITTQTKLNANQSKINKHPKANATQNTTLNSKPKNKTNKKPNNTTTYVTEEKSTLSNL